MAQNIRSLLISSNHGIEVGPTPTRSVIVGVWNPLNQATAAIGYFSCKKHNIIQQNSYWLQILLSVVQLNLVERQQVGLKAIGSNPFTTIMQSALVNIGNWMSMVMNKDKSCNKTYSDYAELQHRIFGGVSSYVAEHSVEARGGEVRYLYSPFY